MKNISFDNPYLLLIAIPLLAILLIPYFISVNKDNRNKGWIASLVIHITIVLAVSLAAAGLMHTTVMTRTKVYVVCDVSYSSSRNLDKIDEYVAEIAENLPSNSRLGIVCFGKDYQILKSSSDSEMKSVKENTVDGSSTDIASAIDYTSTLFSTGEIKRIILITDGFVTESDGNAGAAIMRAAEMGIKVDAIYLNNNLGEGDAEVQISDVEYTQATYLDHENQLKVLVESNLDTNVRLSLSVDRDGEYLELAYRNISVEQGVNLVTMELPSNEQGTFDYKVSISGDGASDYSDKNNDFYFTQIVAGQRKVLLVTESYEDKNAIEAMYADSAKVDTCLIGASSGRVPYTVEKLVQYDEIILSNVDIRKIDNIYAFIDSLDLVVSQYGKSLITLGNLHMQNKQEEIFVRLEEILPVSYGNGNKDSKLYTIVLDISRSMYDTSQFATAQAAAQQLLSILNDDDTVAFITLAGDAKMIQLPAKLGTVRADLIRKIEALTPIQGTYIGSALKLAYDTMENLPFEDKQVMLISDGLSSTLEQENAAEIAQRMHDDGIVLSTVNVIREEDEGYLKGLAAAGGGRYYFLKNSDAISELVFSQIAGDLTDSVVEKQTKVSINSFRDGITDGILSIPDVHGYVNSTAKLDATVLLAVDYQKSSTVTKSVPLYAVRDHGNGRVVSFTSSLTGEWLHSWSDDFKTKLFSNMLVSNTPAEYINYPLGINVTHHSGYSTVEVTPSTVNPKASALLYLSTPDGEFIDIEMTFSRNKYVATIPTDALGKYYIQIIYTYGNQTFAPEICFTRNYSKEYDAFAAFDIVDIYGFMRGVGRVATDGSLSLENSKNEIDRYEVSFRAPLFIAAILLFLVDVIVRKFSLKDIKGLFANFSRKERDNAHI